METKLPNRKHNRWQYHNYSEPGYYFVTICTENKKCWLGVIVQDTMVLNSQGEIAKKYWLEIPNHYKSIGIDPVFVIMPNHIHGIIITHGPVGADTIRPPQERAVDNRPYSRPELSTIIGSYKKIVAKAIHRITPTFQWQKSYYDHVIRRDESLDKIREYIQNNPKQWELDELNVNASKNKTI